MSWLVEFSAVRPVIAATLFLLISSAASRAIVLYDADETANIAAPANGEPWQYVARLDIGGSADASGVYLGNNFILTANHVNLNATSTAQLNGQTFAIDTSFAAVQIGGADIKLFKILGTPGLSALPLMTVDDNDKNKDCTIIGWGVGKGSEVADQGWNWNLAENPRIERWGLNHTRPTYYTDGSLSYLTTEFNSTGGADEAAVTLGDSGGGLFINVSGTWKLAGITSATDTLNQSLYDNDTMTGGDQPDWNYFVPVRLYESQIQSQTSIPEPSTLLLIVSGVAMLAYRRPRLL
jgi:hypothetical protein